MATDIREEQVKRVIGLINEYGDLEKARYHSGLSRHDFKEAIHEGIMSGRIAFKEMKE